MGVLLMFFRVVPSLVSLSAFSFPLTLCVQCVLVHSEMINSFSFPKAIQLLNGKP
jgi:hypothetical protein